MSITLAPATPEDWQQVTAWSAEEGWNPGHGDAACFLPTDPAGFFVGRSGDGRILSAISVVNWSSEYAFLGFYLVDAGHRGNGLGLATWRAAFPHAGTRTVGLDAVPAQRDTYRRSGFVPAHTTVRWSGRPSGAPDPAGVIPFSPDHLDAVAAYDHRHFPAARRDFLARWLTAPGRTARLCLRDGRVTGYGAIRPARDGHRVGPLCADTRADAEALLDSLTAHLAPDETVHLDVPEPNVSATALAQERGYAPGFSTSRMYAGPAPATPLEGVYAVASLELG
ncbi:GNAT family N-acetyltransferase [Streptomyces sp. AV19]|uniref:GNAT family N-acetyltransferase n=1 Tax=Streptomyces sp. AV19 TaxID=2793068 RepID=UPI0018FE6D08|nr:GNAT family N-acetyltransferase [Streptomyces sp. AV19]MBH1937099.1 GNAT family N-acetyltransferase [Streptomyces sp. AV19]MDG4533125.1 GNAT family N-acetyltransferase [Streptomyces sp. AV19]